MSMSFQGSFPLSGEDTWELNTQFPQTISKWQEPKRSLKCSVSTLVHRVLYFQPCMQCFIASQCTLYATLNRGRNNKVILWEKGWQQNFWLLLHFRALDQELWVYLLTHMTKSETHWIIYFISSPSLDSSTDSKGHLTCHELGIVSTYHMWRSQKNIICPDNMVCVRKFQWGFKGKGTTPRYHFIKSLYLLKDQCCSRQTEKQTLGGDKG